MSSDETISSSTTPPPETSGDVLAALRRLADSLRDLHRKDDTQQQPTHWRELPPGVVEGYRLLSDGAELVKATATKFTLLNKVEPSEGLKLLSHDLLGGVRVVATGAVVLDGILTPRSSRHSTRAARAIVGGVVALIECFDASQNSNLSAQKTGAVWSACDAKLEYLCVLSHSHSILDTI